MNIYADDEDEGDVGIPFTTTQRLIGVIRAIELNVDGLNTRAFKQRPETQAALDRIKALCREALKQ